jgi:hypothetical protein
MRALAHGAGASGPAAAGRWRSLRRAFVAAWLVLAVAGGLGHTFLPRLLDRDGWLVAVLPHLKWGYVMFNRIPRRFRRLVYAPPGGGAPRPLSELVDMSSLGYEDARAAFLVMAHPGGANQDAVARLCASESKLDGVVLQLEDYRVDDRAVLVGTRSYCCRERSLRPQGRLDDCAGRQLLSPL